MISLAGPTVDDETTTQSAIAVSKKRLYTDVALLKLWVEKCCEAYLWLSLSVLIKWKNLQEMSPETISIVIH